jgi:hypothetical protein
MISRHFRAFDVGSFSANSLAGKPYAEIRPLSTYETRCVTKMETLYRKLLDDEIYLEGLELMETRIQSMKIEMSYLIHQKHEILRMCTRLSEYTVSEIDLQRLGYFKERHEDVAIRCRILNEKTKALRCRMVGMCYWPLIEAMKNIMNHHSKICGNEICQLKSGPYFVLSNILLLVLSNCDMDVFPSMTKSFSKWSAGNICSHPIIKMIESKIDEQMFWQRNISLQTPMELVQSISTNVFETYEVLYLEWIVINMISTYLIFNHRYSMDLRIILSINGIGMLIYGFLITEERVLAVISKLRVSKKRKLELA